MLHVLTVPKIKDLKNYIHAHSPRLSFMIVHTVIYINLALIVCLIVITDRLGKNSLIIYFIHAL